MHVPKAQQLKGRDVFLLTPHVHSIARGLGPWASVVNYCLHAKAQV